PGLGLPPIADIFGVGQVCSICEFLGLSGIDRNQSPRHFVKSLPLGQLSFRVPKPSLKAPPLPPDSGDTVILRVLRAVDSAGPFDVEQNGLLPESRIFETVDEGRKALSPIREMFVSAELDESGSTPPCVSRRAT